MHGNSLGFACRNRTARHGEDRPSPRQPRGLIPTSGIRELRYLSGALPVNRALRQQGVVGKSGLSLEAVFISSASILMALSLMSGLLAWACVARHVWTQQSRRHGWHWGKLSGLCFAGFTFTGHIALAQQRLPHADAEQIPIVVISSLSLAAFFMGWFMAHVANGMITAVRKANGWL